MPWATQITFEPPPPPPSWKNVLDPCMIEIYTFTGFFFLKCILKSIIKNKKRSGFEY